MAATRSGCAGRREPNTLVDFRHETRFEAGAARAAWARVYGKAGADKVILVPVGTVVHNVDTDEVIGDMTESGQRLLVARGGRAASATCTSRARSTAPRRSTPGTEGRDPLRLELEAARPTCSLLGFPNAGKSR